MQRVFLSIFLFLFSCSFFSFAQKQPHWLRTSVRAYNSTYTFIPITVEANSLAFGRQDCLQMLALNRGLINTLTISQNSERTDINGQYAINGKSLNQYESKSISITSFEGKPIELQAKIIDEYYNARKREFSTLYAVALCSNPLFDDISVSERYGVRGLWRSAIVPGWGQMYKGSYAKGGIIMGGTIGMIAGVIVSNSFLRDYSIKAGHATSTSAVKQYQANINNATLSRNLFIGGLAALYLYNLVDAIVAPGAKRIIVTPVAYGNNSYGISGHLNF